MVRALPRFVILPRSASALRTGSPRAVQPLSNGMEDGALHLIPSEQDLRVVEAQHGVAEEDEPRIVRDVTSPVTGLAMMLESVELNDEALTDECVDLMSFDSNLLAER